MTQRKSSLDSLAVGMLVAFCLYNGFQQVLVKATVGEVPAVFQASLRFIGATMLLAAWCRWRGIALVRATDPLAAGLLAGFLFAAEFACIYIGLNFTAASRLTLFLYTAPFWVAAVLPLLSNPNALGVGNGWGCCWHLQASSWPCVTARRHTAWRPKHRNNGWGTPWRWRAACFGD